MSRFFASAVLAALASLAVVPAAYAEPGGAQTQVRKEMRAGAVRSLREIEQRILPTMSGWEYFGAAYDPTAMAYRLRFVRQGRAVDVDVDARSGNILGQSR